MVMEQITRAFHYRDRFTFLKLYKTYVRPHLEFCTPAWSPWPVTDKKLLESVQEKFVTMISGLKAREVAGTQPGQQPGGAAPAG
jgi:hypothetical protein